MGGILPEDLRTSTERLPIQETCFLRRLVPRGTQRAWHASLLNVLRLSYDSDGVVSSDRLGRGLRIASGYPSLPALLLNSTNWASRRSETPSFW